MSRCQMRRDQWFFLILVAALAVRVLFFLTIAHPEARGGHFQLRGDTDEADYHRLALNVAESGQYKLSPMGPPTALRPPGTVLPIAGLYRLFGPRPFLGIVYVGLCSLAIVLVTGALARQSAGHRAVERMAMLLAALTPTLVYTATGIWSDTPALLFTLLSLLFLLKAHAHGERLLIVLAAASLGAAYLNRPSAAFIAVLVALLLLVEGWPLAGVPKIALFAAVMALPVIGWGCWNVSSMGGFYTGNTQSTVTLWQANNPVTAGLRPPAMRHSKGIDLHREAEEGRYLGSWIPLRYIAAHDPFSDRTLPELEAESWLRDQAVAFARDNPWSFLRLLSYKARRIFTAEPTAPSVLVESPTKRRFKRIMTFAERWFFLTLGSLGMVLLWRRQRAHAYYYLLYSVAGLAVVFIAYPNARILLPVTATLIVPAAIAIVRVWERISSRIGTNGRSSAPPMDLDELQSQEKNGTLAAFRRGW